MARKIDIFHPYVAWRARWNAYRTLGTKYIGEGPQVKEFERRFAQRFGFDDAHVAAVNSGTSALELAYELAGIGEGDEVITPVFTCTATNIPLLRRKAKIVFADITRSYNVDTQDVERKFTERTKAIIFVHYGGGNDGLSSILSLAQKYNLIVIEDAAQAVGSRFWGKADYTAVSFQSIKTLTTADGGMLICRNLNSCKQAKLLRWFGYDRDKKMINRAEEPQMPGYKYQMTDVAASIGLGNLSVIDKIIRHRERLASIYNSSNLDIQAHTWLATGTFDNRDVVAKALAEKRIETDTAHYRNDIYKIFGASRLDLPMMNELENKYLLLPMHMGVRVRDVIYICNIIRRLT